MGKIRKLLFSIVLLGLLITFFFVLIENQQAIYLPVYFISMDDYPLIGSYIQIILFCLSVFFIGLAILLLLITIFYPKKSNTLVIKGKNGRLSVQKSVVENFVLENLKKEPSIENPRVKAKMSKKKIKIKIAGALRKTMRTTEKQNELVEQIRHEVSDLLATDAIKTEVYLKDEQENAGPRNRVE
ncbi:alkaline shock response membrane anchor protein AmaP [Tetragenococcus halophilus]|uniref:alkaline shock response membrane anchor protein AmaP n=1 Tax=Tetragenococcus halophilus TaxID=51669 RepID=UPI001F301F8D|nr:alkaline shock response membrane anchor protein AmaP [Tetragenococcus halophilus]MCF1685552.1 alkaline shock response membrane anchor protein AmaP [Tetragenococcus halophilus]MCO8288637.1 alkaline shock response membrane anchor protein AmaP [Tetragenococcus halophilus]MCO8292134.1 alkaline shock response membrane anchor protein AmaP [Tetragenococcus halophilus]MCO8296596.1 alkaline shock response membrane anchor protein AmaP [Tetragenococcus halophilus]MCT8309551.1 alkaline shock response m